MNRRLLTPLGGLVSLACGLLVGLTLMTGRGMLLPAVVVERNEIRQLTHHFATDMSPRLSPDGRQVAFISYRDGNAEVYVIHLASGVVRNISQDPANDLLPAWSPDSQMLAFVSNQGGNQHIHLADVERGIVQRLTRYPTFSTVPEWLPDGRLRLKSYWLDEWHESVVEW